MGLYIKVTQEVAEKLKLTSIRNRTADGCYLLWQADVTGQPGLTLEERAREVGGTILESQTAKKEIDGTAVPEKVYTPDKFKDNTDETGKEAKDE